MKLIVLTTLLLISLISAQDICTAVFSLSRFHRPPDGTYGALFSSQDYLVGHCQGGTHFTYETPWFETKDVHLYFQTRYLNIRNTVVKRRIIASIENGLKFQMQ